VAGRIKSVEKSSDFMGNFTRVFLHSAPTGVRKQVKYLMIAQLVEIYRKKEEYMCVRIYYCGDGKNQEKEY
jgi:hypothetical protein